jgi:hypothetical protein
MRACRSEGPRISGSGATTGPGVLALLFLLFALDVPLAAASNRYDPRLRFRTLSTARFDVHFHQGEEVLAKRLAVIAERVATDLEPTLGAPRQRVTVILVDQTDLANGWATPTPYNLIEITAVPPHGDSSIGNTADWLRLVFTHEYTHVLHLERAGGWIGRGRRLFGRLPLLHPNLFLPMSQIEGLAVFEESRLTGEGRIPAGDFRLVVGQAAAARRFEPLDRATLAPVDWPSGSLPYAYGGYFTEYLAGKYGEASLTRLADATASRLPYLGAGAYRKVYRKSLGDLWKDFETDAAARAVPRPSIAHRLTRHGHWVSGPRFTADDRLFYSIAGAHDFPALMELTPSGGRTVTTRVLGSSVAAAGRELVFDQLELVRSIAVLSDLYAVSADGGSRRALTRHARAMDPDVSPDGRTIVCAVQLTGRRILATLPYSPTGASHAPVPLVDEAATEFSAPRWSPDGREIVAERRRLGQASEIVVIDAVSGTLRVLTASARGRNVTPVWTPGGEEVLFASDRDGAAFSLYRVAANGTSLRNATNLGNSAQSPALSTDGSRLVFVGYTLDGYDLFEAAASSVEWRPVAAEAAAAAASPAIDAAADTTLRARPYRPWSTLAPRFWVPVIDEDDDRLAVGAATAGIDALGRHGYYAAATWTSRARPDWNAGYAYDRWLPTLFVDLSDSIDLWRQGTVSVRELNAGAVIPFRKFRRGHSIFAGFHGAAEQFDCGPCAPPIDARIERRAVRAGWQFGAARTYGYSISREQGWSATVASELTRSELGASGNASSVIADARGYIRTWPRHGVVAVRGAFARAAGDASVRRVFSAAGSDAQSGGIHFSFDAIGLMRGFDASKVAGSRAAVLNADYRVPLRWVERGAGTWPVFLRAIHGAVFVDRGAAWDSSRDQHWRTSFGAELSADVVLGYWLPVTVASGVAWREDPSRAVRGATAFMRVGRAF